MSNEIRSIVATKQKRWSVAADRLKTGLARARSLVFTLGIAGAFLETLSTQLPNTGIHTWVAWAGAVCLGLIAPISYRTLGPERVRAWLRSRSASEGLKSEVFSFRARAKPYEDSNAAETVLKERVRQIEDAVRDLQLYAGLVTVEEQAPIDTLAPEEYVKERLRDQVQWYRKRARAHARRAGKFRAAELVLACVAAALAAATGAFGDELEILGAPVVIGSWVAVLTTIGGTIAAHVSAARYDFLVSTYFATASRLEDLELRQPAGGWVAPSPEWSDFVHECEHAISTENQAWMARWTPKDAQ